MTTKTSERRAIGDALNAVAAELQTYAPFVIGRVTVHLDAGRFVVEVIDRFGYVDALKDAAENGGTLPDISDFTYSARGANFDDAFIGLAHKLAGTEEAPF